MVMTNRDTGTLFEALDLMLESAIRDHKSHDDRNRQLAVIRAVIDEWLRRYSMYTSQEDKELKAVEAFHAIYQLCIWQLDHETHTSVKDRLGLARNIIFQYKRRVSEKWEKHLEEIRRRTRTISTYIDVEETPCVSDDSPLDDGSDLPDIYESGSEGVGDAF